MKSVFLNLNKNGKSEGFVYSQQLRIVNAKSFNFDLTSKDNNDRTGFALLLPRNFQRITNLIKGVMPNANDEIIEEYKQDNSSDLFK